MAKKVGYSISENTVDQIEKICNLKHWNKSVAIEQAIEEMHSKLFSQPQPSVSIDEALAAGATLTVSESVPAS